MLKNIGIIREELKIVAEMGYNIQILKLYKFSKDDLFSEYVNKFYEIKRISSGPTKFIAKMHLNTLYGYFGRKQTMIETKNILTKNLGEYLTKYSIFSIININEKISTLLLSSNLDYEWDKINCSIRYLIRYDIFRRNEKCYKIWL
jgi:hypothetical protein